MTAKPSVCRHHNCESQIERLTPASEVPNRESQIEKSMRLTAAKFKEVTRTSESAPVAWFYRSVLDFFSL